MSIPLLRLLLVPFFAVSTHLDTATSIYSTILLGQMASLPTPTTAVLAALGPLIYPWLYLSTILYFKYLYHIYQLFKYKIKCIMFNVYVWSSTSITVTVLWPLITTAGTDITIECNKIQ